MIRIKSPSTLLFAVLLTGWVHFTSGQPPPTGPEQYNRFLNQLEEIINASPPDALPLWLNVHAIKNLMGTSDEFKELCLQFVNEQSLSGTYSPVMALNKAIDGIFSNFILSVNTDSHLAGMLEEIKSMDPIGFNVYLTQHIVGIPKGDPSRRFVEFVLQFQASTNQRVRLLNMKTNDSCFEIFGTSDTPFNFLPQRFHISPIARVEIATEYGPLSEVSIDLFTNLADTELSRNMYRVGTDNLDDYEMYLSNRYVDIQLLYDIDSRQTFHAICICYKPKSRKLHVYDSLMRAKLDDRQMAIIQILYPFRQDIIFEEPKTVQDISYPTGAIFALMYASILLLRRDPARSPIKLNTVSGDETLYMRIHILNMLASQKFAFLK